MAKMTDCPTELLLEFFLHQDNIDDALHLAQSSKRTYEAFDASRFYILETIILSSSVHTYDIMLCHFQDALQELSMKRLRDEGAPAPAVSHPPSARFKQCLHADSVSEQQVWDIVARWQGLRSLQHLYLDPTAYSTHTGKQRGTGSDSLLETEMMQPLQPVPTEKEPSHGESAATASAFSPTSTVRFYKALTACWVVTESHKLFQCHHSTLQTMDDMIFDKVTALWLQKESLEESLDVLEVFDFVYEFLWRRLAGTDDDSVTEAGGEDPLSDNEVPHQEIAGCTNKKAWLDLSPADITELLCFVLLRGQHASTVRQVRAAEMRTACMRPHEASHADYPGPATTLDAEDTPYAWYSHQDIEQACEVQLQKTLIICSSRAAAAWRIYRATRWQTDGCGRFGQMPSTRLLELIAADVRRADGACG